MYYSILSVFRLKLIKGTDAFILEPVFSNTVYETMNLPFSKANELAVYNYLLDYCRSGLERINAVAAVAADEQTVAQGSQAADADGDRAVLMARLRVQERAALAETIRKAEEEIGVISVRTMDISVWYSRVQYI